MATVTSRARSTRVLALAGGGHASLAPGQTRDLDLAPDHPVHSAWERAGDIVVVHDQPAEPTQEHEQEPEPETVSEPELVEAPTAEESTHERKRRNTSKRISDVR